MKHIFKKVMQMVSCVAMTTLLLSSCGESGEKNIDYLAVRVSEDEGWSIIDKNGKIVVEDEYSATSYISAVYDGVYWVETNGTFQLFSVDSPKKPIIDEEFTQVTEFQAGRAAVFVQGEPIRLIDTSGKTVVTFGKTVKGCTKFSEDGLAAFRTSNGKDGIIDKNGKVVIKAEYALAFPFGEGVIIALKNENDKNGIMLDTKGRKLFTIPAKYECSGEFSEGKALFVNTKSGTYRQEIWNKEGKRLFVINNSCSTEYENTKYIDGYIIFRNDDDDKYGIVDSEGKTVIRAKYKHIINLGKGEFAVSKNGDKWGIVNTKDEEILDFYYSYALDATLGGNYLMKDGSEFLLIKRGGDNEVLGSFYAISLSLHECQYIIAKDDAETDVYTDDTEDYPYVVDSICGYDTPVDYVEEW